MSNKIEIFIGKTAQNSANLTIEVGAELTAKAMQEHSVLLKDIDSIGGAGSTAQAHIEYDHEKQVTIIKMVAINPDGIDRCNHRQYVDIALRLADELGVKANQVQLKVAFGVVGTLDMFEMWFPAKGKSALQGMTRELDLDLAS